MRDDSAVLQRGSDKRMELRVRARGQQLLAALSIHPSRRLRLAFEAGGLVCSDSVICIEFVPESCSVCVIVPIMYVIPSNSQNSAPCVDSTCPAVSYSA